MAPPPSAERGEAQNGNERGSESGRKRGAGGGGMTEIKRERREGGRDGQRGNKLEGGQRSETSACQAHANDDTRCVATSQRGMKIFFIIIFFIYKKKNKGDETAPGLL